jgi:hypothetical protein
MIMKRPHFIDPVQYVARFILICEYRIGEMSPRRALARPVPG